MVINSAPSTGSVYGWVCTASGYPGTWFGLSYDGAGAVQTITAAVATLSNGYRTYLLSGTNSGSTVLPDCTSHATGWQMTVLNNGTNSATLAANAANSYAGAAAITLAAAGVITLIAGGGTLWYKVA